MNKIILILFISFMANFSFADCSSPAAIAGSLEYFSVDKTHKFCDGTNWVAIKKGGLKQQYNHDFAGEIYVGDFVDLTIDGNILYVIGSKLTVINITDPANPVNVAQYDISGNLIRKDGNYLHIWKDSEKKYFLYDTSNINNIFLSSEAIFLTSSNVSSMLLDKVNKFSYFVTNDELTIIDYSANNLSGGTNLVNISGVSKIAKDSTKLYALNKTGKSISVIDISFPMTASIVNTFSISSYTGNVMDMSAMNDHLYVTYDNYNPNPSLLVFDATNPLSIVFKKSYLNFNQLSSVEAFEGTLNFISRQGTHYFARFNPADPSDLYTSQSDTVYNYTGYDRLSVDNNWVVGGFRLIGRIVFFDNTPKLTVTDNAIGFVSDNSMAYDVGSSLYFLRKAGNRVALSFANTSLFVMDVSNPSSVTSVGSYKTSYTKVQNTYYDGFDFDGTNAYRTYANYPNQIEIMDVVTDPLRPKITYFSDANFSTLRDVIVDGSYMYVASSGNDSLLIFDITTPHSPVFVGKVTDSVNIDYISVLKKVGNIIYTWGIFSGTKYLTSIDVSDPANPVVLGSLVNSLFASVEGFTCTTSYCVINKYGSDDTFIIDVSNPSTPTLVGTFDSGISTADMSLVGNTLYVANTGFKTYDISIPSAPSLIYSSSTIPNTTRIVVDGSKIYLAGTSFRVLDVVSPTSYLELSNYTYSGKMAGPLAVDVIGDRAFVLGGDGSIATVDITDRKDPFILNNYTHPSLAGSKDLKIKGNYAYVLASSSLLIFDLTNPVVPTLTSTLTLATELGGAHRIFLEGNYAYITAKTNSRFTIVDITNVNSPALVSSTSNANMLAPENVTVKNDKAYIVSTTSKSLVVFDITNKSSPSLYSSIIDTAKLTSPLKVEVTGNSAVVVAANSYCGGIFDISTPTISFLANLYTSYCSDVIAKDSFLYLKTQNSNYTVVNIKNPSAPIVYTSLKYSAGSTSSFSNAVLRNNYIYSITGGILNIIYSELANFSYVRENTINTSHPVANFKDSVKLGDYIYSINSSGRIYAFKDDGLSLEMVSTITPTKYKNSATYKMVAVDNFVFVYDSYNYAVSAYDVTDPYNIVESGMYSSYSELGSAIVSMHVYGNYLVLTGNNRIVVLDITVRTLPTLHYKYTSSTELSSSYTFSAMKGDFLYVCSNTQNAIRVYSVVDPGAISLVASVVDSTNLYNCAALEVEGDYLYHSTNTNNKLTIFDISTPASPSLVNAYTNAFFSMSNIKMKVKNDTIYYYTNKLYIFDVSDKLNPLLLENITISNYENMQLFGDQLYFASSSPYSYTKYQYEKIVPIGVCSQAGSLQFNSTKNVMAYCDGTSMLPLSTVDGAGGAGCSSPTALAGSMKFFVPANVYKFCDGTNWKDL